MNKVSVVILNWNGKKFLEQFLGNVIAYSSDVAEIVIADNGSTDESVQYVKENYPQVRQILLGKNYGFAGGYNRALQQVDSEYYILLNTDVEVTENWIEPVINFMDKNPKYSVCQPKLLSYYERDKFEYAGGAGGFIDFLGYPFCRGRIFQELETDNGQYNDMSEIFWATGACMFIKANVFHEVGGFDEDFFAHMEEIDLCWRLKNAEHYVAYVPYSTVYHVGGGTLPKSSSLKTYLNMRNNIAMLYKNLPLKRLIPVLLCRFILDSIAAIKFFFDGGFKDLCAVTRAQFAFVKNFTCNTRKRKKINQTNVCCVYKLSIVFRHYLFKINKFSQLKDEDFTL